jgi:WD40 repeat protein
MNCTNLNTAAEILEAFRACNNPGEEIELFECLATRPDPPVRAFVDILRSIKLEAVVALTIQAFGKITDADIKVRLKESEDLLTMLSQQAQSGSSDLIRWSAATTIDNLGFDFIDVSRYLSEEPRKIAEKIAKPKIQKFETLDLRDNIRLQSPANDEYINLVHFFTYASLELRQALKLKAQLQEAKKVRTLTGHSEDVVYVAFSSDGQILTSISKNDNKDEPTYTIKTWELTTGKELSSRSHWISLISAVPDREGYTQGYGYKLGLSVRFNISPDAQMLAASFRKFIRIWQLSTGQELLSITEEDTQDTQEILCLAFSPDGQRLASGYSHGNIKVWQLSTGQQLLCLKVHNEWVSSVAFSPDGQRLISRSGEHGNIKVWQLSTGQELLNPGKELSVGGSSLTTISPDGQILVIAHGSFIEFYQMSTEFKLHTLYKYPGNAVSLAISPDGQTLVCGGGDTTKYDDKTKTWKKDKKDNTIEIWQCNLSITAQPVNKAASPSLLIPSLELPLERFYIEVKSQKTWGYCDQKKRVIVPPQFDEIKEFYEGFAAVKINTKWGYIDQTGNIVISHQFDEAEDFSEGFAVVKAHHYYGYIDKAGNQLTIPQFYRAYSFSEGLALVGFNSKDFGYINDRGQVVINLRGSVYSSRGFSEGLAAVHLETKLMGLLGSGIKGGYIDKTGQVVIKPQFDIANNFSEGLACVGIGHSKPKYGYIDKTGQVVIKPQFDIANNFSEGLACVGFVDSKIKYGYIDKTGKVVIKPQFDSFRDFHLHTEFRNGRVFVKIGNQYGWIDKTGKFIKN